MNANIPWYGLSLMHLYIFSPFRFSFMLNLQISKREAFNLKQLFDYLNQLFLPAYVTASEVKVLNFLWGVPEV